MLSVRQILAILLMLLLPSQTVASVCGQCANAGLAHALAAGQLQEQHDAAHVDCPAHAAMLPADDATTQRAPQAEQMHECVDCVVCFSHATLPSRVLAIGVVSFDSCVGFARGTCLPGVILPLDPPPPRRI